MYFKLLFLIQYLLAENKAYDGFQIPKKYSDMQKLYRALVNVREALPISDVFLKIQDEYLNYEIKQRGIIDYRQYKKCKKGFYIIRGSVTILKSDLIVNDASSDFLGCTVPCHTCIDNEIHTFSGIQLKEACKNLNKLVGKDYTFGSVKITKAYNLPSNCILHTVAPYVDGTPTQKDLDALALCYKNCLETAKDLAASSIGFCLLKGSGRFPLNNAAEVAIEEIAKFKRRNKGFDCDIIFMVDANEEYELFNAITASSRQKKRTVCA